MCRPCCSCLILARRCVHLVTCMRILVCRCNRLVVGVRFLFDAASSALPVCASGSPVRPPNNWATLHAPSISWQPTHLNFDIDSTNKTHIFSQVLNKSLLVCAMPFILLNGCSARFSLGRSNFSHFRSTTACSFNLDLTNTRPCF